MRLTKQERRELRVLLYLNQRWERTRLEDKTNSLCLKDMLKRPQSKANLHKQAEERHISDTVVYG
jgi:hypothetical protein